MLAPFRERVCAAMIDRRQARAAKVSARGLALGAAMLAIGCGPKLSEAEARDQRARLRSALDQPVATRDARDAQSRLLAEVKDSGALDDLNQAEVRAAIGKGQACRYPICAQNGFSPDDYYYEIGLAEGDEVKQLPVLIVGFDPRGRATRIWTLSTH
jgi:hypothetical protein